MALQSPHEDLKAIRDIKFKIKTQFKNIYKKEPTVTVGVKSNSLSVFLIIDSEILPLASRKRPEASVWTNCFDNKTQINGLNISLEEIRLIQEVLDEVSKENVDPYSQPKSLENAFRFRLNIS